MQYDVAIIGGGPAGSTLGSYLQVYGDKPNVLILEREKFPRDHVGESQLPPISKVLAEIGCWDKVEAAGFPIKIGATYLWGKSPEPWDFEFIPREQWIDEPRPAKFEGQRRWTAFQVDRAIYDQILLDHAKELGCEVREQTKVVRIERKGDTVTGLTLDTGEVVTARHYVDASGHSGLLRRAMGVEIEAPSTLQNIAIWDYWQNADWAVEIGVGGTLIQILSLPYGWFWFIPLGPTRTSIGFVTPAEYIKRSGMKPAELYAKALSDEKRVSALIKNATSEGKLQTTKDWSFVSERLAGENWFLVGESAGFADPILSAGLSLAQEAAREVSFTILELGRGKHDPIWLKDQYQRIQQRRIQNHIRFADYWYTANAQFEDLKEFTQQVAADNGLDLTPEKAWAWLAQGGFIDENLQIGVGGFTLDQVIDFGEHLTDVRPIEHVASNNIFELDLTGATWMDRATYLNGKIGKCPCYVRGERALPIVGVIDLIVNLLQRTSRLPEIADGLRQVVSRYRDNDDFLFNVLRPFEQAMEALVQDGWVKARFDPAVAKVDLPTHLSYRDWAKATA